MKRNRFIIEKEIISHEARECMIKRMIQSMINKILVLFKFFDDEWLTYKSHFIVKVRPVAKAPPWQAFFIKKKLKVDYL